MVEFLHFHSYLLRHRIFNIKTAVLVGILWLMEDMMLSQIAALGAATGEYVTPAVYVFLQSYGGFLLLFFLEIIVFYTDVPFTAHEQLYVMLRSGKVKWYLNQIVYIVISSFFTVLTMIFICLLRLAPVLKFSLSWDRILGTLALTDAGMQFEIPVLVPYKILNRYEPTEAMLYSLLVGWGVVCFIGVFMFSASLVWNRRTAIIIITLMVLIFGIQNYYPSWIRYVIPLSWMQITELGIRYSEFAPTEKYVCIMLPVFIGVIFLIGFLRVKSKDFEWLEEE